MCGIFGHFTPAGTINPDDCFRALETLSHRGPDGAGVALGHLQSGLADFFLHPEAVALRRYTRERAPDFFLGHRRLSVIDLSPQAFQPMANSQGTIWVVYNGEVYNHRQLRRELEARGHRFRTDHADTEVLVHGYEEYGEHVVDYLRGMFAFAILDLRDNRLVMARDRFGEKPLYYSATKDGLSFASELKALVELPQTDREISNDALVDYLHHGMIPAPRSIYKNIRKLRAAERVTIRLDAPQETESEIYWDCRPDPVAGRSEGEWLEAFEAELQESVRLRMISDVPLGAFLSGGLDSTVVLDRMSRASTKPVNTFSIGFSHALHDESPWANRAAKHYGSVHHALTVSPADLLETVGVIARMFDEPFADSSAVPTYLVSRLARRHVTVALSGDGGDELLAGYRRYPFHRRLARLTDRVPNWAVTGFFGPTARLWPERVRGKGLLDLLAALPDSRYLMTFRDDYLVNLLDREMSRRWHCILEHEGGDGAANAVDAMCRTDRRFYIPEDLMVKVDRASMRVSLEARAPLLDHKLFELVAKMPLETRFNGRVGKLPFRRMLAGKLGSDFVKRPKRGFSVPLGKWFRNELRDELRDTLLERDGIVTSLISRKDIERIIDTHETGSRDQSHRLWKLYMLQQWHATYGKQQTSKQKPLAA
jgi:asparagine synthase (glutamine-hydrolysing)